MPIAQLDWDSEFFGFKIGILDLQNLDEYDFKYEIERAASLDFSLLYLTHPYSERFLCDFHRKLSCLLVDTKVTYAKSELCQKFIGHSSLTDGAGFIDQLYELAFESGKYSRFKLDPRFGIQSFKMLYRAWVDNSVGKSNDQDIFVYEDNGLVLGFCLVEYPLDRVKISLIGVSPQYQGKGIGRDLCKTVEAYTFQRGFRSLTVATQLVNHGACKFYEKMGMNLVESVSIYHLWL